MKIQINNVQLDVNEGITVCNVFRTILRLESDGKAIAINDTIIPRDNWDSTILSKNDKVIVIKACSGG